MRYPDFVQRVRRYKRSSFLRETARLLWRVWNERRDASTRDQDVFLAKSFGARLAAISAACGNEHRSLEPRPEDLFRLAHELLAVDEALIEDQFVAREKADLAAAWAASRALGAFPLDEQGVTLAWFGATGVRMIGAQWHMRYGRREGVFRTWEFVRRLYARPDCSDLDYYLRRVLRVEPLVFLRSAFFLMSLMSNSGGELDVRELPPEWKDTGQYGIDRDVLLLVAEHLSLHHEDFLRWDREDVQPLLEPYRRLAPNPLSRSPLIQRRGELAAPVRERGSYVAPSPWYMLIALQTVLLDTIRAPSAHGKQGFSVELGYVLEDYLFDFFVAVCGRDRVFRVDALIQGSDKHADIIVVIDHRALVLECKSLLGSDRAKSVAAPADAVSVWERIARAYAQCGNSVRDEATWHAHESLKQVTEKVSLACFDEQICLQGPAFNAVAAHTGFLGKHGVGAVETVTLQQLEGFIGSLGPDGLFEAIKAKWAAGRIADDLTAYVDYNISHCEYIPVRTPAHLVPALRELLPGVGEG